MNKDTNVSLFFYRSKIGFLAAGILFSILFIFLFYHTWIVPHGPHQSGLFRGIVVYWFVKFVGVPMLALIVFYTCKTAFSKSSKIVELRVGKNGVWRRGFNTKTYFIPWSEISTIYIEKRRLDGQVLVFKLKNLNKYLFLKWMQNGVEYHEGHSPVAFKDLIVKLNKFKEFKDRFDTNSFV